MSFSPSHSVGGGRGEGMTPASQHNPRASPPIPQPTRTLPHMPALSLLVLRVTSLDGAATVYSALGITFDRHRHGAGPEHLAATLDNGAVLELYPRRNDADSTSHTRLGFAVPDTDAAFAALTATSATAATLTADSPWGRRAVIKDPDGHTIGLTGQFSLKLTA